MVYLASSSFNEYLYLRNECEVVPTAEDYDEYLMLRSVQSNLETINTRIHYEATKKK